MLVSTTGGAAPAESGRASLDRHAHSDGPVWSRDGSKMAFVMDGVMHVMPTTPTGEVAGAPRRDLDRAGQLAVVGRGLEAACCIRPPRGLKLVDVAANRDDVDVPINLTWTAERSRRAAPSCMPAGMFDGKTASLRDRTSTSSCATTASSRSSNIAPICIPAGSSMPASDVVMPGLIEMHAHLSPGIRRERSAASGSRTASPRCATPRRMATKRSR